MSVDIKCGKCGKKITTLRILKPIKDVMKAHDGKCPFCNRVLSTSEFTLDALDK